ncbi:LutC/YkgG family protein [Ornithinibacillus xuwenensis]|uniref:Lactate utilization protein C n=1 Tax=Ornithinibacillus xuwenensis TaxID=3144668 RepID=A0ABU9XL46_9BACI
MTVLNRETFLTNLADNLGRPRRITGVERPTWSVQPQWDVYQHLSSDELIDILEKQCQVIHTDFKRTDRASLEQVLRKVIEGYNGQSIVAANDPRNKEFGLQVLFSRLMEEGKEVHVWDSKLEKDNITFAERADVGITFSDITLAESGTVTLFNNRYNGRSISLLPKTYIAIIPKETIVQRMTQAAKQIHDANQQGNDVASCVSFITGPSNSADIEMNLIVGVHGPIQVTYIVVD